MRGTSRLSTASHLPFRHSYVLIPSMSLGPTRSFLVPVLFLLLLFAHTILYGAPNKKEQHRAEQILDMVSRDVQNNFYDPTLKGLDWPALTEQARQRIRNADELGQMY